MVRGMDGHVSTLLPRDLLPGIDIYGQNEIYELAQDEASRIQLLDRFLPQDGEYEAKSADVHGRLKDNQQKLTKALTDLDELNAQVERLPKLEEQLRGFDELGIKEKLAKASLLAREREIARAATDDVQSFRDALSDLRDSLPDLDFINNDALQGVPDAAQLLAMRARWMDSTRDSPSISPPCRPCLMQGQDSSPPSMALGRRLFRSTMPSWRGRCGRCLPLPARVGRKSALPIRS